MRAVIQRVTQASVEVHNKTVAHIADGLLVLLGLHHTDTDPDIDYIINKILGLRVFDDENAVMNKSITEIDGEVLLVSQFTLYGDARKGKRPSYSNAMPPHEAVLFFNKFVEKFREKFQKVQTGSFGAHMEVAMINSGPVTILLDSTKNF